MSTFKHGNISIHVKDDKFISGRKIPVYHNNEKPVAFIEMKGTNDLVNDTPQREIILSHTGKKLDNGLKGAISLPDRVFHDIILTCRETAEFFNANFQVNTYTIGNDVYQNILKDGRRISIDTQGIIEFDPDEVISLSIDRSSFIRKPDDIMGNVVVNNQLVDLSHITHIDQRTDNPDRILGLIARNNQNPFPDHDMSNLNIVFSKDSYENVLLNFFGIKSPDDNGLMDYEDWSHITLPKVSCSGSREVSIIMDMTISSIDINSFQDIINATRDAGVNFHFNDENRVRSLLGDSFITHPIFNRFFIAIEKGEDAYEEVIEMIIYMQLGSLYKKESLLEQIGQVTEMLSMMPDNSNFFGMTVTDKNRDHAVGVIEQIIDDINER